MPASVKTTASILIPGFRIIYAKYIKSEINISTMKHLKSFLQGFFFIGSTLQHFIKIKFLLNAIFGIFFYHFITRSNRLTFVNKVLSLCLVAFETSCRVCNRKKSNGDNPSWRIVMIQIFSSSVLPTRI